MIKNTAKKIYVFLIFVFLYAPIATLIVLSFNASKTRAKWGGFTLKWYIALFKNDDILQALFNTLAIALIASLVATVVGTIACIAIMNLKKRSRTVVMGITNIPMLNADIVTGISLMLLFISMGLRFGFGTILLSHITFCIPYVILSVMPRMKQLNPSTFEAALDLGCTSRQALVKATLPEIMPGIASGFLLAITLSLDDFIVTAFTRGAGLFSGEKTIETLSTLVQAKIKKGPIPPTMRPLTTFIFLFVLAIVLGVTIYRNVQSRQAKHRRGR